MPEAPGETWAKAAVERFAELIREQRAIFRASQRGGERGATSLSPRPFQVVILSRREQGSFYDRLPLPLACGFPFSLNAQFDPGDFPDDTKVL
ncbi:MAG: hypothetical protein M3R70_01290 [Actinomycetota bacterium]|nr:hypothetical protein [Actinomycetota bacterium]